MKLASTSGVEGMIMQSQSQSSRHVPEHEHYNLLESEECNRAEKQEAADENYPAATRQETIPSKVLQVLQSRAT